MYLIKSNRHFQLTFLPVIFTNACQSICHTEKYVVFDFSYTTKYSPFITFTTYKHTGHISMSPNSNNTYNVSRKQKDTGKFVQHSCKVAHLASPDTRTRRHVCTHPRALPPLTTHTTPRTVLLFIHQVTHILLFINKFPDMFICHTL